jgi:Glycine zipper
VRNSVFLIGALLLATFVGGADSQGNDKPTKVCQVVANWTPQVQFVPDTVHEGRKMPGIVGRLYLFGEQVGFPLTGDGMVHLELSAILPERPQDGWICLEKLDIDKESLKKLLIPDDPLLKGPAYTMFLPWWSYRPDVTQIQMTLSYTPEKGTPLCSTSKFSLKPSAHDKPDTPSLDLVPPDCDGFVTARVAQLAEKLALKKADGLSLFDELEKHGLKMAEMDRLTMVFVLEGRNRNIVAIMHTTRPIDRIHVMKSFSLETKEVKYRGQVIYVKNEVSALCFLSDRILLVGPEKDIRHLLAARGSRTAPGPLTEALARAATHDIVAWGRVIEPKEETTSTSSSDDTDQTSKKNAGSLGTLVSPDGPSMLPGATSADLTLDIGKQVSLRVCIHFADEESARRGVKYACVGVEMLRAKCATQSAAFSLHEVSEELGIEHDPPEMTADMANLLKRMEKALQRVKVEANGTTIPVSLSVPADARTVASAVPALLKLAIVPGYRSEPNQRVVELTNQSENLRQFYGEWERFWMLNHPSNLNNPQSDALGGGLIGAAVGGLAGVPRHPLAGAAIGGAVGAGTGAVIGNSEDKAEQREAQARMLGLKDIAQMTSDGQSDDVIIGQIRSTDSVFRLSVTDLQWLKENGVSDRVINEMQAVNPSRLTSLRAAAIAVAVGSGSTTAPAAEPLPPPRESVNSLARYSTTLTVSPTPVKLAIANVAKEPALLFLQSEGGQLTFERKVPAGEAVDVETPIGQRWVAIFADNPASENYVAAPDKTIWLLRGASRKSTESRDIPIMGNLFSPPPLAR